MSATNFKYSTNNEFEKERISLFILCHMIQKLDQFCSLMAPTAGIKVNLKVIELPICDEVKESVDV